MSKRTGRPSKRQRADALAALHQIATDPTAPEHARGNAARALLNAGEKGEKGADNGDDEQPTPVILILPVNYRDAVKLGIGRPWIGFYRIDFDGGTAEGLRALDRWQDEIAAEIRRGGEPDAPLALPAEPSPKPSPLTGAERQARYRERKRASAGLNHAASPMSR